MAYYQKVKRKVVKRALLLWPESSFLLRKLREVEMYIANSSSQIKKDIDSFFHSNLPSQEWRIYKKLISRSKSQCRQDILISFINNWNSGSIIEVGSTDGVFLSNSEMLERFMGWECVLVEPCRSWQVDLKLNRPASKIIFDAISHSPNLRLKFTECEFPELSGLTDSLPADYWSIERGFGISYEVFTTTLDNICDKYIFKGEFLAVTIDIEGGEIDALRGFEKNISSATLLVIENNGNAERIIALDEILLNRNFVRLVWPFESFDSWYLSKVYLSKEFLGTNWFAYLLENELVKTTPSISSG